MRFYISFNWKTLKKWLIPIVIALAILFGFNTMQVHADTVKKGSTQLYIEAIRLDKNTTFATTFTASESAENNFVLWGPSTIDAEMIKIGALTNYTSLGASNYQAKIKFYVGYYEPVNDSINGFGCSSWASDIYNNSCYVSDVGYERSSNYNGYVTYYEVTYNFSTYGSSYVEFWLWFNNKTVLQPNNTYFSHSTSSFEGKVDNTTIIVDQNDKIINQNEQQITEQKETNKKIDELKEQEKETYDYLTDDTPPESDISALGNVQGLLPPGPVDSLLNIPFKFLSVINSSFGGVCVPLTGEFVYDSTLTLPCFSEMFYDEVPSYLLNFLSLIPASFILIKYLKHLYKKVDRAVSMETTADDEWGVL